jgi:N-acetylmuramoyl-L-alanine amidase/FlgD Ig-like domain
MRKAPTVLLLSLAVPALSALPVITVPAATAHPVAPDVRAVALRGVDPTVLSSPAGVRSSAVATRAWRENASPNARATFGPAAAASSPAVLASAQHTTTFSLLGVTWRATKRPADLTVVVRSHAAKGWSAWTPLEQLDEVGPSDAAGRLGTEPLWVGDSDGYQVRVDLHSGSLPTGLRVDLVAPGNSPADATAGQVGGPAASAAAAVSAPVINSRASWGADERLRNGGPYYNSTIKEGFVHHTAGTNNYSSADVPKIIRGIYAYHTKSNGWSDIGYNFLVDRFGRLWEGRYGGITRAVRGAHTGGFNVDSFAVSAIGDYGKVKAPTAMIDAIARLLAWKLSLYYRNPMGTTTLVSQGGGTSKYPAGRSVSFNVISGHRDAGNTECPGNYLYNQLANIRSLTSSYLGAALISPAASTDLVPAGTSLTVTARTAQAQQWRLDVRNHLDGTLVRTITGSAAAGGSVKAVWDQLDANGAKLRPGAYDLSLSSSNGGGTARTWHHRVALLPPAGQPATAPAVSLPGTSGFVALDPTRIYDSLTVGHLPLGPGQRMDLHVLGAGGVPSSGVGSVALTVTARWPTSTTSLSVWPAGATSPASPTMTVESGTTRSALAVSALGGNGLVSLRNSAGVTEVAVDVVGYYPIASSASGQRLHLVRPFRLYDSRASGIMRSGTGRTITLPTSSGIASSRMGAAIVNVTALSATGAGDLVVHSPGSGLGAAVTLTYSKATNASSRTITSLSGGALRISVRGADTQVLVDVIGWYAPTSVAGGQRFQAIAPRRVLDTSAGIGAAKGSVRRNGTVVVTVAGTGRVLPSSARAVLLNLISTSKKMQTYRTSWPAHPTWPSWSDIYLTKGRATSNLVLVRVRHGGRKDGKFSLRNYAKKTNLVADVVGYYR